MEGVNPPDFKSKNLDDWIKIADFYRKRGFSVKSDPDANKGAWRYIGKGDTITDKLFSFTKTGNFLFS